MKKQRAAHQSPCAQETFLNARVTGITPKFVVSIC